MSVLGYSFSNTATSPLSSGASIPNMSCSFTLTGTEDVLIEFSLICSRSAGSAVLALYIDGTLYAPNGGNDNYYSISQGENNMHQGNGSWIVSLASGSHTVEMKSYDALAVASTTFYNRCLIAQKATTA